MAGKRLIVGITGARGAGFGGGLLQGVGGRGGGGGDPHFVLRERGALNCWHELRLKRKDVERLAHAAYHPKDIAAAIASGSFLTEGMVIAPCSMKTLAAVAQALSHDLLSPAPHFVL